MEKEVSEWQAKYGKVISEMGAEPIETAPEPKELSFEEKLKATDSWLEKDKLIKAEMPKLLKAWNQN